MYVKNIEMIFLPSSCVYYLFKAQVWGEIHLAGQETEDQNWSPILIKFTSVCQFAVLKSRFNVSHTSRTVNHILIMAAVVLSLAMHRPVISIAWTANSSYRHQQFRPLNYLTP